MLALCRLDMVPRQLRSGLVASRTVNSTNARREPMPYGSCAILFIQWLWSYIAPLGVEMLSGAFARTAEAVASCSTSLRLSAFFPERPKCTLPESITQRAAWKRVPM